MPKSNAIQLFPFKSTLPEKAQQDAVPTPCRAAPAWLRALLHYPSTDRRDRLPAAALKQPGLLPSEHFYIDEVKNRHFSGFFVNSFPEKEKEILIFFLKSVCKDTLLLLTGFGRKVPSALRRSIRHQVLPRQHLGPQCPKMNQMTTCVLWGESRGNQGWWIDTGLRKRPHCPGRLGR